MLTASAPYHTALAQTAGDTAPKPIKLAKNYRKWQLISVAHEEGDLQDIRGILANDVAAQAFRRNATDFPNGSKIVRLAWKYTASVENKLAFGRDQSFVAGVPTNIQMMVRDTKRYAATGGWGWAQFSEPGAKNEVAHPNVCVGCHISAKDHGYVFTRYAR